MYNSFNLPINFWWWYNYYLYITDGEIQAGGLTRLNPGRTYALYHYVTLSIFFKDFLSLFLERREGGERGGETSMCGCLSNPSYWGT